MFHHFFQFSSHTKTNVNLLRKKVEPMMCLRQFYQKITQQYTLTCTGSKVRTSLESVPDTSKRSTGSVSNPCGRVSVSDPFRHCFGPFSALFRTLLSAFRTYRQFTLCSNGFFFMVRQISSDFSAPGIFNLVSDTEIHTFFLWESDDSSLSLMVLKKLAS